MFILCEFKNLGKYKIFLYSLEIIPNYFSLKQTHMGLIIDNFKQQIWFTSLKENIGVFSVIGYFGQYHV